MLRTTAKRNHPRYSVGFGWEPDLMEPQRGIYEKIRGSGIWWIRFTDGAGNKRREKAGAFGTARKLLEKRHTAVLAGEKLPETRNRRVKFSTLCDDAIAHSKAENSDAQTYDLTTRLATIRQDFGNRAADSITKKEIVAWLETKAAERKWSPATRNRWQAGFSLVYRVGIDNELITKNPAAKIRRKTENNGRVRFLSDEEEARLVKAIRTRFPEFLPHLMLSLHSGMRMSEQYSLTWGQVDFQMRLLYLPKTKNGDARSIPLNDIALHALHQLKKQGRGSKVVFPSARAPEEGGALQGSRGWFPVALEEAKLEQYSWHCNRHTFASRLVMAGVDLRTVASLLGHRTLQMVMRYSHLAPQHQADAVARLVSWKQTDIRTDTDGFDGKKRQKNVSSKSNKTGE